MPAHASGPADPHRCLQIVTLGRERDAEAKQLLEEAAKQARARSVRPAAALRARCKLCR
jgi:hypothetical protein